MKIINHNFFLKKSLILLIFIFSGCQAPHSTFKQRPAVYNLIEKVIESKDNDVISKKGIKNKNFVEKTSVTKPDKLLPIQIDDKKENKINNNNIAKKKEELVLNLKNLLQKTNIDIIPNLGSPSLVINHGKTINYQYHLAFCFVDLFFIKNLDNMILNHYELRPIKINSEFKKALCKEEISKLLNKKEKL